MTKRTRVVHCKALPYDVYIGRGNCPRTGVVGQWGNPFTLKEHGPAALTLFVNMLDELGGLELGRVLAPLRGRVLGCWCGKVCHGHVLARLCDGEPMGSVKAWVAAVVAEANDKRLREAKAKASQLTLWDAA